MGTRHYDTSLIEASDSHIGWNTILMAPTFLAVILSFFAKVVQVKYQVVGHEIVGDGGTVKQSIIGSSWYVYLILLLVWVILSIIFISADINNKKKKLIVTLILSFITILVIGLKFSKAINGLTFANELPNVVEEDVSEYVLSSTPTKYALFCRTFLFIMIGLLLLEHIIAFIKMHKNH